MYSKKWHKIHTQNLRKRESTRAERLLNRRLGLKKAKTLDAMRVHMNAPETMDLISHYEETCKFIYKIKKTVFSDGLYVFLNFSTCKYISPETCVVLASEIDRCRSLVPKSVHGAYPSDPDVYFQLNELGFFGMLGIKASKPVFDDAPEVDVVKLTSGSDNPENLRLGMKELFDKTIQVEKDDTYTEDVWRALSEAMINSIEHAYPEKFRAKTQKTCLPKWWRAGFKDNEQNNVIMVFFDQGTGIPNTINPTWEEKVKSFVRKFSREPDDNEKIVMAMEKGRSSTKVEGRGQGSFDMQKLIRQSSDAHLNVLSYNGRYTYKSSGEYYSEDVITPLPGTLLIWKICLNTKIEI